jgi:hypothetical protein
VACYCLSLDVLLDNIEKYHVAAPVQNGDELNQFERTRGRLPNDLKRLYSRYSSLTLYDRVQILPLAEILTANEAVFGNDSDDSFSPKCFAFCQFDNGQYVGYQLEKDDHLVISDLDPFYDGNDGVFTITTCLRNFLTNLLVSRGSTFWLDLEYKH